MKKRKTTVCLSLIIFLTLQLVSCSDNGNDGGRPVPASSNYLKVSFKDNEGNDLSKLLKSKEYIEESIIDPSEYKFRFYVDDREIEQTYLINNIIHDRVYSAIYIRKEYDNKFFIFAIDDWMSHYEQYGDRIYTIKYTFKIPKILGLEEHTIICKKTANQLGYQVFKEVLYDGKPIQLDKYEVFNIVVD